MVTNVLSLLCTVNCTPVPTTYRFCVLYLHFEGFLLKCFDRNNHLDLLTRATIRESKRILCSKALNTNSPPQVYNSACSKSLSRMRTMTLQNSRVVCGSQCSVCMYRSSPGPTQKNLGGAWGQGWCMYGATMGENLPTQLAFELSAHQGPVRAVRFNSYVLPQLEASQN